MENEETKRMSINTWRKY